MPVKVDAKSSVLSMALASPHPHLGLVLGKVLINPHDHVTRETDRCFLLPFSFSFFFAVVGSGTDRIVAYGFKPWQATESE